MTTASGTTPDTLGGYLSGESKRRFTITAGILGALFFLAQMILPVIVMMIVIPVSVFSDDFFSKTDVRGAVVWAGSIWLTQTDGASSTLKRIDLEEAGSPEEICVLPGGESQLLADATGMWILSSDQVTRYDDEGLGRAVTVPTLGDCSQPFLVNDRPAVVEDRPEGAHLLIFDGQQWQRQRPLDLGDKFQHARVADDLQVLNEGSMLHVFLRYGGTLYYRTAPTAADLAGPSGWQAVCPADRTWQAGLTEQGPVVFCLRRAGETRKLFGYRPADSAWEQFFVDEVGIADSIGVCSLPGDAQFVLLVESFPGSLRMLRTAGSTVAQRATLGRDSLFPWGGPFVLMIPHVFTGLLPLILAVVLSGMMRKHRVTLYRAESGTLPYASLARRAVAQGVDALVLGGPYIVGFALMMSEIADPDAFGESRLLGPLTIPLLMGLALLWVIICVLVFSAMEGSSGGTPGKWFVGIRVLGADLKPCGFGRAFVRNLLKFVDGFFNFLVGVMIAALSENWQRVGDMAARTVVLDVRKTRSPGDVLRADGVARPSPEATSATEDAWPRA